MSVMLNFSDSSPQITMKSTALVELMGYLGSLQLWLGVVLALPLLWGAVYMRRRAAA